MSTSFNLDGIETRCRVLRDEICARGGEANPANRLLIEEFTALRARWRAESAVRSASPRPTVDPIREPVASRLPGPIRGREPWEALRALRGQPHEMGPELRGLALRAVEKMPAASDAVRELVTRRLEAAQRDQAGPMAAVTLALTDPEYVSAWLRLAARPEFGMHGLTPSQRAAVSRAEGTVASVRALSLTDSAGGYLAPLHLDPGVVLQSGGSSNQVRRVARQVVALSDVWHAPTATSATWSYDAEGSQVSDDSPTFGRASIPLHKASGYVPVSIELFQDAENLGAQLASVLAAGRDFLEATAFAIGSGVDEPAGIVTALTGTPSEVSAGTPGSIAVADLYALLNALPARHASAPGSAWLASPEVYSVIRRLNAAGGADIWTATNAGPLLLDRPALIAEGMSSTLDGPVLVVGDFDHFVIADRVPTRIEFIPNLRGPNGRPTGHHGVMAWARHGAAVTNVDAFRMLVV